jgi:anti-anti-sigma factor
MPAELDLATADDVAREACAAIVHRSRVLLLDLAGSPFWNAYGLSAFTGIANRAEAAGCGYGLVGPLPSVARVLRISGLAGRLPVFATFGQAFASWACTEWVCARRQGATANTCNRAWRA